MKAEGRVPDCFDWQLARYISRSLSRATCTGLCIRYRRVRHAYLLSIIHVCLSYSLDVVSSRFIWLCSTSIIVTIACKYILNPWCFQLIPTFNEIFYDELCKCKVEYLILCNIFINIYILSVHIIKVHQIFYIWIYLLFP